MPTLHPWDSLRSQSSHREGVPSALSHRPKILLLVTFTKAQAYRTASTFLPVAAATLTMASRGGHSHLQVLGLPSMGAPESQLLGHGVPLLPPCPTLITRGEDGRGTPELSLHSRRHFPKTWQSTSKHLTSFGRGPPELLGPVAKREGASSTLRLSVALSGGHKGPRKEVSSNSRIVQSWQKK